MIERMLWIAMLTSGLVAAMNCAQVSDTAVSPAAVMGAGNFDNAKVKGSTDYQLRVLNELGMKRARINLYPGAYLAKPGQWDPPAKNSVDAMMAQMHAAGIEPILLFEYYSEYHDREGFGNEAQWEAIGRAFATRYAPGGAWATEQGIGNDYGVRLYTAMNEPEPKDFRLGGKLGPEPYVAALRGLSRGVKSVDPELDVAPGGYMAANDGRSLKTRIAFPWNIFYDFSKDTQFGMSADLENYEPSPRGKVLDLVLELTEGMTLVAADPLGSGMLALIGEDRTMWVWQNRTGWTDRLGESVTLHGVPADATKLTLYHWQGLSRRVELPADHGGTFSVAGLEPGETWMFIADAPATAEPRNLLPPDAYRVRPDLQADQQKVENWRGAMRLQETFDADPIRGWSLQSSDGRDKDRGELRAVEAQGAAGRCAHLTYVFLNADDTVKPTTWRLKSGRFMDDMRPGEDATYAVLVDLRCSRPGRHVRLYMHDADGETLVTKPRSLDPRWRTYRFDLTGGITDHWGGSTANGKIDWPIKLFALEILNWGGASAEDNEQIWVDDLRLIQARPSP